MTALAAIVVVAWIVIALRGFWLFRERDDRNLLPPPAAWPAVVAVVPARDEADVIARTVAGLLAQDYPGRLTIRLVDDASSDGTSAVARSAANGDPRLTILTPPPRPAGWTGKLWAVAHGIDDACAAHAATSNVIEPAGTPVYLWLTDADIGHAPETLRNLVTRIGGNHSGKLRVMVSTMARLHCSSFAERALIPAFVYFFAMLFPFRQVNGSGRVAAAAGGCVLVDRAALAAAGGIASIRGEIIDDCALARQLKRQGPIWLGLSTHSVSLRPYGFDDIRKMVARSAYAQLKFSPWLLAGTVIGMALLYLAPPLLTLFGRGYGNDNVKVQLCGLEAWGIMAITMLPILRYYRVSVIWGIALPLIAFTYATFTIDSAVQQWRGRGGMWKGRAQALSQT